jgi:hypothetical protein
VPIYQGVKLAVGLLVVLGRARGSVARKCEMRAMESRC